MLLDVLVLGHLVLLPRRGSGVVLVTGVASRLLLLWRGCTALRCPRPRARAGLFFELAHRTQWLWRLPQCVVCVRDHACCVSAAETRTGDYFFLKLA